jgi:hypothetical protein
MKQRFVIGVIAIACVVIALGVWRSRVNGQAQTELLDLWANLSSSATSSDVESNFSKGHYQYLELRKETSDHWLVETPVQFGASNWCLHLTFAGPKLAEMRIRLLDSSSIRPDSAPQDVRK